MRTTPNIQTLRNYRVNRPGQSEVIWNPLYDFQTRATTGVAEQKFFQTPIGQSSKTKEDTNMDLAGNIPAGRAFLVTGIEVVFFPGSDPVQTGTGTGALATENWNDAWKALKAGYLKFEVGSKSYLEDGPLMKFPPTFRMVGGAAEYFRMTTDADQQWAHDYAVAAGKAYDITPVELMANQNFAVSLLYPSATVNITNAGRIGVILNGFNYRLSQ